MSKSNKATPDGGKKGRRSFAGQRMAGTDSPKGGAGRYNWGDPMDDFGEDDYYAIPDEEAQAEAMRRWHMEQAEMRAAEKEYRRTEEANRAAAATFVASQKAKKAALAKHISANPYDMLDVQDEKDVGPPIDFAFASPAERIRASMGQTHPAMTPRQMRREEAEWSAALSEDRRIRNREGMNYYPSPGMPMPHPMGHMDMHMVHGMPVSAMERARAQEEHFMHMRMAQQEHAWQARQRDLSQQPQYQYYRGPNEKHGQRFQPRGHERYGH